MPVVGNRIKVSSSSTGTGNIILGSADAGFQTFADGGISNNDVVRYTIIEGSAFEIATGTYLTSGPTLQRSSSNLLESSTGSLLDLGGSATVFVTLADVDVMQTEGGTFTGDVIFDGNTVDITFDQSANALSFDDGARAYFGSSSDLTIYHEGVSSETRLWNVTGDLNLTNFANDKDIVIATDNGSGGTANYFLADGSTGEAKLFFYGSEKLATKTGGVEVQGTVTASTIATSSGDFTADIVGDIILDAGGGQLIFKDDNTQIGQISNVDSGNLTFQSDVSNKDMVFKGNDNGTIVTALTLDMSDRGTAFFNHDIVLADYGIARFGDGNDLQIFHNSFHTFIDNATGDLTIRNRADDKDVIIECDDGTGFNTTYFLADGSTGEAVLHHYGSQRLATQTGGVSVTGDMLASGKIGLDSTDYITFTDNTQMDVYINGSNEFRFEADGDFHADGNVIAYSTTIASDASLKENIQPVLGLQSVMALDGVSFDWKRDGKKSAGVIAQQVQKIMPEAVTEVKAMNGSKHLSVNYNALTSVLIEAIKDLKTEIEDLKNGSHK